MSDNHPTNEQLSPPDDPRSRARERMRSNRTEIRKMTPEEVQALVYELQLHQAELEITNDELLETQSRLAQAHDNYAVLYEHAPTAYLTLDDNYIIKMANKAATALFARTRNDLPGLNLSGLAMPEDRDQCDLYLRSVKSVTTHTAEVRFLREDGGFFWGRLHSVCIGTGAPEQAGLRVAIIDLTYEKQTEAQLRATEEQLRFAQESAGVGSWDWNISTGKLVWSDELFRLYGMSSAGGKATFDTWRSILHPDDRDIAEERIDAAVKNRTALDSNYRIVLSGGEVRWIHSVGKTYYGGSGMPIRMSGICMDITDRQRTVEELERVRNMLAEAQKIAHLGSFEYIVASRTTVWSEEEYRIYGLDPDQPSPEYDVMLARCIYPDDAALLHDVFTTAIRNRSSYELEHRIVRPNGSVRWVYDLAKPYFDDKGNLLRYIGATLDITERKVVENALRDNREDLQRAQAVGRIGSWRLDVNKNELTWSDENHRIFGIPRSAPLSYETFLSKVHPDDREYVDRKWMAGLAGEPYDIEHRIIVDGTVKWVREKAELEFDTSGKFTGGFGTTQDITSRKQDEEELRKYREGLEKLVEERTAELRKSQEQLLHAQKMEALGLLAGGVAHDFNNMMQVVIGYTHRTLHKLDFENPLRENLEHIGRAAKSAATLTHRLLAFSRKQMLQPQVFSLNDLVVKVKPMLGHTIGEDIELSCVLQPELAYVKADPVQLEQVIVNMAVNARNAMPAGGALTFTTADVTLSDKHPYDKDPAAPGPYVMLSISDTGCGMDAATREKIFEPFFTTRPFGTGSGLGLATAYGTIRQSGGAIRVYSEPGKGTTFKVYLPRCEEKIRTGLPDGVGYMRKIAGKTILVVEDNTMAREFVSLELGDMGYNVLAATNGEEAISLSRGHAGPIDLLLTDVVLPGASGWDVSTALSEQRPETVTLYMSGYDADNIIQQGKLMAGVRLLVKPFTPEQLAAEVREALLSGTTIKNGHREQAVSSLSNTGKAGPLRILVVDDDPGIAEIIAEVLRKPGDIVKAAEDGATALRLAGELIPDVVLLDIKLPDTDGYELSRRIRKMSAKPDPYIIAASGLSPEGEAGRVAFDDYITKPIDFTRLRKMIDGRLKKGTIISGQPSLPPVRDFTPSPPPGS